MAYQRGRGAAPQQRYPPGEDPAPDYFDADPQPGPHGSRDLTDGGYNLQRAREQQQQHHHHHPDDYYRPRSGSGDFDNVGFRPGPAPGEGGRGAAVHRSRSEGPHAQVFRDLDQVERQPAGVENLSFSMGSEDAAANDARDNLRAARRHYYRQASRKKSRRSRRRRRGGGGGGGGAVTDDEDNFVDDDDDDDKDSVNTLRREDLQRALDILATIRVRRRQRKSLKRQGSQQQPDSEDGAERGRRREEEQEEEDKEEEEEYEEMVGMPSAHVLEKNKSLAERLQELRGTSQEVARSLRERYNDFDPSLVASAAWKGWEKKKAQISDIWAQLDIWSSHFKEIEGRFGNATASYFRFTRWLIFLNFYTFLVSFLVVVVPFLASGNPDYFLPDINLDNPQPVPNASRFVNDAINCSSTYITTIENYTDFEATEDKVLDFFVGTGWMEHTSMFYGFYHNRTFHGSYNYNMGLAYIMAIGVTFLISFILILFNSSSSVKQTVVDEEQSTVHFTNSVICGWDYCIMDAKSAHSKKRILCQEFKGDLLEQNKRLQRENRTYREKVKLIFVRIAINFVVLCMLAGCIYLIYFATSSLLDLREKTTDQVLLLIIQLLPSLTITLINFIVPEIFNVLVQFEDYWPALELKITLIRTVFLRLSSLGVLTFTLYYTLLWPNNKGDFYCGEEGITDNRCCGNFLWEGQKKLVNGTVVESDNRVQSTVQCWETYVGQQFYKLALVDFAALLVITFIVEFPRKLGYEYFKGRIGLVEKYGQQEFDIPRNVLDIVYSQTLSWLGSFFAPLLPAMTLLKVFIIFYIKKLTLMKNFAPPKNVYRVSRSNSFFNLILLISFVIVAIIIGYMLGNINPSKGCGPYRLYSTPDYVMWTALTDVIAGWPNWASTLFFFFGTTAFFVPCFIVLCLLMYYYWAVGQGYKRREEILKEQLRLEGKDKHYLLARVNDVIKQGNLQGVTSGRS